ncbi:hypothetical protein KEJ15_01150 [Candidatus Bathyarchaeota archaeon]|nr:hypothetical protein [Candidatus Bathyarchaeota archaeon]
MSLEERMQSILDRLGVPLRVKWIPKINIAKHGEITSGVLYVYDKNESEAWLTFQHEVFEYKFKEVTYVYRTLVNSLIEGFEKLAYERKEKFLEFLPRILDAIAQQRER